MKTSVAPVKADPNIHGGLKLTSCTTANKMFHRKRVIHKWQDKKPLRKRANIAPDTTYTSSTTTFTLSSTVTFTTATSYAVPDRP